MPRREGRHGATLPTIALLVATVLTACSGSGSSPAAAEDAKAACAALVRSKNDLSKPDAPALRRLVGAASLGSAAAQKDKRYQSLDAPMNAINNDVQTLNTDKLLTDARATLSVCSDLGLAH